jgi:hypothetical protein
MGVELVVLDFDGNLTNVDIEAIPFVESYKTDFSNTLNIERPKLDLIWAHKQSLIESNPSAYGWTVNGMIVAPAYADPLIMSRTIAGILLKDSGITDESIRSKMLDSFFQNSYGKLGISFKEDADRFLSGLKENIACCVMTNSKTDGVVKKIAKLPTDHSDIVVYGDAKKYLVTPEWEGVVPNSIEKDGFGRPLFVRRQQYWNALHALMQKYHLHPENVAVVGDIYELDLLLPEMVGMHTILTPREKTPAFEINAVLQSRKGYVAQSLDDALDYLLIIK